MGKKRARLKPISLYPIALTDALKAALHTPLRTASARKKVARAKKR